MKIYFVQMTCQRAFGQHKGLQFKYLIANRSNYVADMICRAAGNEWMIVSSLTSGDKDSRLVQACHTPQMNSERDRGLYLYSDKETESAFQSCWFVFSAMGDWASVSCIFHNNNHGKIALLNSDTTISVLTSATLS